MHDELPLPPVAAPRASPRARALHAAAPARPVRPPGPGASAGRTLLTLMLGILICSAGASLAIAQAGLSGAASGPAASGGASSPAAVTDVDLLGQPAPDFSLPLRSGGNLSLSAARGRVQVLNFWATWCPPCVEEIPSLNRLYRRLEGLPIDIVGISVDDSWAEVDRMLLRRPVRFSLALDPARGVPVRYGTSKFPETFVIDKQGRVVRKLVGAQIWDRGDFIQYLRQLALAVP